MFFSSAKGVRQREKVREGEREGERGRERAGGTAANNQFFSIGIRQVSRIFLLVVKVGIFFFGVHRTPTSVTLDLLYKKILYKQHFAK